MGSAALTDDEPLDHHSAFQEHDEQVAEQCEDHISQWWGHGCDRGMQ